MKIITKLRNKLWPILPVDMYAKKEMKDEKINFNSNNFSDELHLQKTINWLIRAQNATPDHGVARGYSVAKNSSVNYIGWEPSYPETTGYIIPTILAAAKYFNNPSLVEQALRMANWEIDIQLPSGAVMGSVITAKPSPAVFNTGQVIFGWVSIFKQTKDQKYLNAAIRAGDYLLSVQGQDGNWHKGDSNFALKNATTYNSRVAWAMIELGKESNKIEYINSGKKNVLLAISKQKENGWFSDNCLNDPDNPLLHTIIYATRGILEAGVSLNNQIYINSAKKALDSLLQCQKNNGSIPGRLNSNWKSRENWDCLTGDAQAAIAWIRLYTITGDKKYYDAARLAINFIKRTQNLNHKNPGIRGGVKGSYPFNGEYGQFEMLNWAAKFFCDSLMLINNQEMAIKGIQG